VFDGSVLFNNSAGDTDVGRTCTTSVSPLNAEREQLGDHLLHPQ
jgi:hypothetical protein